MARSQPFVERFAIRRRPELEQRAVDAHPGQGLGGVEVRHPDDVELGASVGPLRARPSPVLIRSRDRSVRIASSSAKAVARPGPTESVSGGSRPVHARRPR